MNTTDHKSLLKASRYWLLGKAESDPRFYDVLTALRIAEKYHTGIRKDGVSHELYHQMNIFSFLRSFVNMVDDGPMMLIVGLLHDTGEDYPESYVEIKKLLPDAFDYVVRISKIREGSKISYEQYFGEMAECPVTSIVKIVDRIHNLSSMEGCFTVQKQQEYVNDVHNYFLPMLKTAKRNFPKQEPVYENLKSVVNLLVDSITNSIDAKKLSVTIL